uniref:PiggyBac transposable element-derived protein 4-like n=1 Tax=Diabrotica virgifera virgifera TaxID=50390 RepID=A0A6P7H2B1_DIAVI
NDTDLLPEIHGRDISRLTKPTKIVLSLANDILGKGHRIVTDNYYSSPELFDILCDFNTDALGTVRINRKNLPTQVTKKKLKKGENAAAYRKKLMCLKWSDKKDITMLSTTHDAIQNDSRAVDVIVQRLFTKTRDFQTAATGVAREAPAARFSGLPLYGILLNIVKRPLTNEELLYKYYLENDDDSENPDLDDEDDGSEDDT